MSTFDHTAARLSRPLQSFRRPVPSLPNESRLPRRWNGPLPPSEVPTLPHVTLEIKYRWMPGNLGIGHVLCLVIYRHAL